MSFKCPDCDWELSWKKSGVDVFICPICNKTFIKGMRNTIVEWDPRPGRNLSNSSNKIVKKERRKLNKLRKDHLGAPRERE